MLMIAISGKTDCKIHISSDGLWPNCRMPRDPVGYNIITSPDIWNWSKQVCAACDISNETEAYLRSISTNNARERLAEAIVYFGKETK